VSVQIQFHIIDNNVKIEFLPTPHRIHNNQLFTVPEDSNLDLAR